MKFIKKEIVETTIANEDVNDLPSIISIVESIYKQKIDISISFNKMNGSSLQLYEHKKARIDVIDKEKMTFDITSVCGSSYTVKVKSIAINSIVKIEVFVNDSNQFARRDNVTRIDMLDISKD